MENEEGGDEEATMCLMAWAWRCDRRYDLLLLANRDEWHARPTAPLHVWPHSGIWAGSDLQAGGTWLGLAAGQRMAALTNVREPGQPPGERSRGLLVSDYLQSRRPAVDYIEQLMRDADRYAGFNLLLRDGAQMHYVSNRYPVRMNLPAGVYGLSNAGLDSPWPKLLTLRQRLHQDLAAAPHRGWSWLQDRQSYPDDQLPDTGVGLAMERLLAAAFIVSPAYGTRSSALLGQGASDFFCEQSWDASGTARAEPRCLGSLPDMTN